jgi:hypothetical protein
MRSAPVLWTYLKFLVLSRENFQVSRWCFADGAMRPLHDFFPSWRDFESLFGAGLGLGLEP